MERPWCWSKIRFLFTSKYFKRRARLRPRKSKNRIICLLHLWTKFVNPRSRNLSKNENSIVTSVWLNPKESWGSCHLIKKLLYCANNYPNYSLTHFKNWDEKHATFILHTLTSNSTWNFCFYRTSNIGNCFQRDENFDWVQVP